MTFLATLAGMDEEQRRRVGEYVRTQRMHKYGTVDAARIAAEISRGAWDAVEQGKKVRDFTYGKVEKALELPAGYLDALSRGQSELMEALVDTDAVYKDLMEWAASLKPGIAPDRPPTDALAFWSTSQILESLAEREEGHREAIRWHVQRYEQLQARLEEALRTRPERGLSRRDQEELEARRLQAAQAAVQDQQSAAEDARGAERKTRRGT